MASRGLLDRYKQGNDPFRWICVLTGTKRPAAVTLSPPKKKKKKSRRDAAVTAGLYFQYGAVLNFSLVERLSTG